MYEVGIFATGRGQGSRGLLEAVHAGIESGHLPAKVAFVFSNREPGEFAATDEFFKLVRGYRYPLVTCSFRKFRSRLGDDSDWRRQYELEAMKQLEPFDPDLCVLAGFLLIVPEMCHRYTMVNLHPAAPGGPVGMWQEVIWRLIESRARVSGNTMFHVTEELDKGPTVTFSTYPIHGEPFDKHWKAIEGLSVTELRATEGERLPLFQLIRQRGMDLERPLVVETLKAFSEGRVRITDGHIIGPDGKPMSGLDLTTDIGSPLPLPFTPPKNGLE